MKLFVVGGAIFGVAMLFKAVMESFTEDPEMKANRAWAEDHEARGAVVYADLPGWPQPPSIRGHRPDGFAVYADGVDIVEFENDRSVDRTHARRQDASFSAYAARRTHVFYEQVVVVGGRGGHG